MELGAGAEAGIGEAPGLELRDRLGVDVGSTALVVGTFVPVESEPGEVVHDETSRLRVLGAWVEVLDSQDHAAAGGARRQPCQEARECVPQVHAPGGSRRKAPDDLLVFCQFRPVRLDAGQYRSAPPVIRPFVGQAVPLVFRSAPQVLSERGGSSQTTSLGREESRRPGLRAAVKSSVEGSASRHHRFGRRGHVRDSQHT